MRVLVTVHTNHEITNIHVRKPCIQFYIAILLGTLYTIRHGVYIHIYIHVKN